MTVAAVDIGTNSVRLLVVSDTGHEIERHMRITRLGRGVDASGCLDGDAIERTLSVLRDYAERISVHGVTRLRAAATSAARDARNADDFVLPASEILHVKPEVVSGLDEAALAFAGATGDIDPAGAPFLVADIGGGSTELVLGGTEPAVAVSVDMGCVRVSERHLRSDPPAPAELEAAGAMVDELLDEVASGLPGASARTFVGLAGTVTSLAAMDAGLRTYDPAVTHHRVLSRDTVADLLGRLTSVPTALRRGLLVEPERADVIVGGAVVLRGLMAHFGFSSVLVSEHDILDGLVRSLVEDVK
ncbi:MAG: exopolyphosphatase [Acidimicrobiia bacterium]|nr:exopolyphosphatase [Acidimicrobiia bacterium]